MAKNKRSSWGSIRKRGQSSYEIRYKVNGKPQSETFHGSERDAEKRLAELRVQYDDTGAGAKEVTLNQFWSTVYHPEILSELSPSTVDGYEQYFERCISPQFGSMLLSQIGSRAIQDWILTMTKGKALHAKRILSAILSRAKTLEYITSNPANNRFRFNNTHSDNQRSKDVYTLEELDGIFNAANGEVWEAAFILAGYGGAILSEAMSPKLDEITFEESDSGLMAIIPIQRSVQRIKGEVKVLSSTKNEYREDALVIAAPYSIRLKELVELGISNGDTWLTDDGLGNPNCPARVSKAYGRWFKHQPFRYVPFSNLRNSYSTILHNELGVDDTKVHKMMRHANPETDYKHYNRPSVEHKIEVAKAFSKRASMR